MTEQLIPWTHLPGALAWAPMPNNATTPPLSSTSNNSNNKNDIPETPPLFWPVILYPSWSTAARSPLFDCNHGEVLLIGCQKPVSKENLCLNRVPSRVALGKGVNGSKFRLKVVAHFLGVYVPETQQHTTSESWGSVSVDSLQQYTLENCETHIQIWERNGKDVQWNSLLNAMKEAATLMEQNAFDPLKLCKSLGIDPNYKNFSSSSTMDSMNHGVHAEESKDVSKDITKFSCTPENFHDWNHQSESQTQTQAKFSQAILS